MLAVDIPVDWYDGPRDALRPLFELAEDSTTQLASYVDLGRVLVARRGDDVLGHLQLVETGRDGEVELKNMAVREGEQGHGVGRALVATAVDRCRSEGRRVLLVGTGAADVGNLRFYQRCGFRFLAVERDAFTPESGYPDPIDVDGIPLLDRVWLSLDLA
jgi:GNAT superfamily N-acetyltransferase